MLFNYFVCVCVWVCHSLECGTHFSPSITWIPGLVTGSSLYLLTHLAGLTFYFSDRSHYIALVGLKFMIILLNARMTGLDHHASSKYFKLLFYIANVYSQILLSVYFFLRFILFVFMAQMPEEVIRCAGIRVTGMGWDLNLRPLGEKQSFSNTETPLWPPILRYINNWVPTKWQVLSLQKHRSMGKKNPVSTLIEPKSIREGRKWTNDKSQLIIGHKRSHRGQLVLAIMKTVL